MEKISFKIYFKNIDCACKIIVAKSFDEVYASLTQKERESISNVYSENVTII